MRGSRFVVLGVAFLLIYGGSVMAVRNDLVAVAAARPAVVAETGVQLPYAPPGQFQPLPSPTPAPSRPSPWPWPWPPIGLPPVPPTVTWADDGHRYSMQVGESFWLALGPVAYRATSSNPAVLRRFPTLEPEAPVRFTAVGGGWATVTDALPLIPCHTLGACSQVVRPFHVTIHVDADMLGRPVAAPG